MIYIAFRLSYYRSVQVADAHDAMKICPACKTQYSDDTLSFCLQDGTPLAADFDIETPTVTLGEVETAAVQRGVPLNVPIDPGSAAWQPSQVTHVATLRPKAQRPVALIAVALTAAGMLLLFGLVGIGAWIFLKDPGKPGLQNVNNSTIVPGGGLNNGASPMPQQTPFATPVSTRSMASPGPQNTPEIVTPPSNSGDGEPTRSEVSQRVYTWKSMLESRNFNGYMGNYADTVDYYNRRNASVGSVRADKARAFSLYNSMRVNVSNMSVSVGPNGDTATVVFDKEWSFSGRDTSSGKVRSQLGFRNINGRWLITSEKDLKVYYTR